MQPFINQTIAQIRGSWRFRWLAIAIAWGICVLGWPMVYGMQDTYESRATVYVDTNSALRPLLRQLTIDSDVLNRVEIVTKALLGRPQLERVARETDLHLRAETEDEFDQLVRELRDRVLIINNERVEPNLYEIRFRDSDREMAQRVVANLLNAFVEDSLGANRQGTQQAQDFLRSQLDELEQDLVESERKLAEFKKANVGRMPDEGGGYFSRLQAEISSLDEVRSELRRTISRKTVLEQQLSGESPVLDVSQGVQSELDERLAANKTRLEELQLRFTDLHPEVIAVEETIEQLEAQKAAQLEDLVSNGGLAGAADNPVYQNIQIELTNANVEIASLREQESTHVRKIAEFRELVDVLPEVEAELARLTRDYDVKQTQYQALLQSLEVAELSESAEQSEDVKFRIIDPPSRPDNPVAPDRPLLLFIVLALGIGCGAAVAFFLNLVRPVFATARNIKDVVGLPVLGSVSALVIPMERSRRRAAVSAFAGALILLVLAFFVVFLFHEPGSQLLQNLI